MIRPFSAGLMSSPQFRPMFGHGFQGHFEATTRQPTSLNPQIPLRVEVEEMVETFHSQTTGSVREAVEAGVQIFGF